MPYLTRRQNVSRIWTPSCLRQLFEQLGRPGILPRPRFDAQNHALVIVASPPSAVDATMCRALRRSCSLTHTPGMSNPCSLCKGLLVDSRRRDLDEEVVRVVITVV